MAMLRRYQADLRTFCSTSFDMA